MPLEEFSWIPQELLTTYLIGLRERFKKHGKWEMLPGALWDQDTMVFIAMHKELSFMAQKATNAWRKNTRNMYWAAVTAIILAIESLASNFNGNGDKFPEAKRQAEELFEKGELTNRTRLLDIYMPNRT